MKFAGSKIIGKNEELLNKCFSRGKIFNEAVTDGFRKSHVIAAGFAARKLRRKEE